MGPEESDALMLFRELYAQMRRGLDTQYLTEARLGLELAQHHLLVGRIEMDSESDGPVLVVDGRPRSWEEIGRLLLTYEGWNVRFEIADAIEETPDVPESANPSDARH